MNKEDFFLADGLLVQNDKYILNALTEEDKENYLKLYRENSIVAKVSSKMSDVDYDEFAEFIWKKLPKDDAIYVSIFLSTDNTYVGNITMKHLSSDTPELGIDVLQQFQRRGIAYETIPMFAKRVLELKKVEYFMVRVYSDNVASTKLFEKLGVVKLGKEQSEFAEVLAKVKEKLNDEYEDFLIRNPYVEDFANENCILQYRYLPD